MKIIKTHLYFLLFYIFTSCGKQESIIAVFQPNALIGKDTSIYESTEKGNFSTLDRIQVLSLSSNDSIRNDVRSLIRFGFTTLPEGITIDSAFVKLNSIDPGHYGVNNSFMLVPVTDVWINKEVNWKNQPRTEKSKAIFVEAPKKANQNFKINVKDYVTSVIKNEQPNYGFMIQLQDEKKAYKGVRFHSSNSKETTKHPKLEIFYHK